MRTRWLAGGALVALVLLALVAIRHRARPRPPSPGAAVADSQTVSPTAGSPEAAEAPIHGQMQLVSEILQKGLTAERAERLFSFVVGPLPGVRVPRVDGGRYDFDGTLALSYIYEVWDSLTDQQRAVAEALIQPPGDRPEREPPTRPSSSSGSPSQAVRFAELMPAGSRGGGAWAFDYQSLANDANGALASRIPGASPVAFFITVDDDPPTGADFARTWTWYKVHYPWGDVWKNRDGGCEIRIHNQKFVGLPLTDAQAVVTHEMFHCYQQRAAGSADAEITVGKWVSEGEATWVMFAVVPGADVGDYLIDGVWKPYGNTPSTNYSLRSYDGVGVFGHMSDVAGSSEVWLKLLPLVQMDVGRNDKKAFLALIQGHNTEYWTSWGSSYFVDSGHATWTMAGPGPVPSAGPTPNAVTISTGYSDALVPVGLDESAVYRLSGSADIAIVSLLTGYGRLHDKDYGVDVVLDESGPLHLCLKEGGCKCPDGSPGASLITKKAVTPLSVGINGGDEGAQLTVEGRSLDEYCKQKEPDSPPPPPPGGGGGGGGGGDEGPDHPPPPGPPPEGVDWGDTHIGTFDGLGYDFQVTGEYTLIRSTVDDFSVQVRQVPVLGPKLASVNQAVATTIGGQRLTFTMENGAPVLRIDGKVVTGAPPRLKTGSLLGAVTAYGGTYILTWPDGTVLRVEQLGSYAINVRVRPAESRRGTLIGLLGNFDGSPDNDLVGRDDARLGQSREDIDQRLASAWRLTAPMSLFDYQPGQSPDSFYDPDFPARDADAARLTDYATAEETCRAHGITDPRLLEDCILDLAVTNSFVFASRYAHAQRVLAARGALASPTAAVAAPIRSTFWVDGDIRDAASEPEVRFEAAKGDVVWVGYDPDCEGTSKQGNPIVLDLMDPTGELLVWHTGCDFGRFELPVTGSYAFKGVFKDAGDTIRYHVPVRFARPDHHQEIAYGQIVSGEIEQWAAHDVYAWTATAGDLIVLSGEGCTLPFHTSIIDADGHDYLGPDCRTGTYWKVPQDGTYQLVVNGGEWTHSEVTGPYRFVFQGGKPAH